jgi:hypothetical protein
MSEVKFNDPFNPKKIYDDLIKRCKDAQLWPVRCIIEESWTGIAPFQMLIEDGIFTCFVIAPTKKDAMLQVMHKLPVVLFLDELE